MPVVVLRLLRIPELGWVLYSMFSGSQRLKLSLRLLLKRIAVSIFHRSHFVEYLYKVRGITIT
jgi:hypothetical protein